MATCQPDGTWNPDLLNYSCDIVPTRTGYHSRLLHKYKLVSMESTTLSIVIGLCAIATHNHVVYEAIMILSSVILLPLHGNAIK